MVFFGNYELDWLQHAYFRNLWSLPVNIELSPDPESWYHLAISTDGVNVTSYLNGNQMNSNSLISDPISSSIDFLMGNNIENGDHFFKGILNDVSIWKQFMSEQDIQFFLENPILGNENNLVALYNLMQPTAIFCMIIPETKITGR